jgi:putative peptidoglycan lipid II flippase
MRVEGPVGLLHISPLSAAFRRLRRTPLRDWPLLEFNMVEGSALYVLAFIASASLGILRQILLNARFGLSDEAAAYYAAFRLPETIGVLIAGGALTNALVPVLLRVRGEHGDAALRRLTSLTLSLLLMTSSGLALVCGWLAPQFVQYLLAPGFAPPVQALTTTLARIMLLEVVLVVTESVLVAPLIARNQLVMPAVAIGLRNITLIGGTVLALVVPEVGIYGPTVGAILDALLQIAILAPVLRRQGYWPFPAWNPGDPGLRSVLRLLWPNSLSGLVNYAGSIVDVAFASLVGTAAVAAMTNAFLLIGLPIRLIGIAIGQAALPHLTRLSLSGNMDGLRRSLRLALGFGLGLSGIAVGALLLAGRPVIGIIFERGAFDVAAGNLTYLLLAMYAIGLPGYVATEIATRGLVARFDTRTPLLTNMLQLGGRVLMIWLTLEYIGALAIPAAFALTSACEGALLLLVLRWNLRGQGSGRLRRRV